MGLRQRVVCYACQVAVFLTENCSLVFYFFATEGFYRKKQKLPDLVDFQGFACYNILNIFESVDKAYSWLPLSGVTPHSVGRCHEVTKGTAAVSGCHHR